MHHPNEFKQVKDLIGYGIYHGKTVSVQKITTYEILFTSIQSKDCKVAQNRKYRSVNLMLHLSFHYSTRK